MLWSQQVYIKLTWHRDLGIQLWCHSIDTTFPKNIATTLYMKSSFQITQISFLHEYRNIICTLFLFGNHYFQKVQFSIIYIVQIFNYFKTGNRKNVIQVSKHGSVKNYASKDNFN